jgi:hypothetical protein
MARIRSIKPDFFASEDVSQLTFRARLTWVGLWTHADDHGRCKDVTALLKAAIWPLDDVTLDDIEDDLDELAGQHRIVRYEHAGRRYIAIVNWHVHQAINRPKASELPAPRVQVGPTESTAKGYCTACAVDVHASVTDSAVNAQGAVTPGREGKGSGMEGERARRTDESRPPVRPVPDEDQEPPRKCRKHIRTEDPPSCRACGDARREHDAWLRRQRSKPTPTATSPPCPRHADQPASRCRTCESEATPPPDLRALRGAS